MADPLSLKRFLAELDSLVTPFDEQQLRSALTRYARTLPSGARIGFLEDLRAACQPTEPATQRDSARDMDLVTAIEEFTTDVESGMYYDEWGWDPELRHERACGDESWAPRMDALFTCASDAFLAGHHDISSQAHQLLFSVLALEGDEGPLLSYEDSPAESLTTDLTEAAARYLRSLYEISTDPADAAENLAATWLGLPYEQRPSGLIAVREALPDDLPNADAFFPHWTHALVERAGDYDPLGGALLREAALLSGGADALAEAAQREGPGQPETYLDLANALSDRGEAQAALDRCREGLRLAERSDEDRMSWAAYQWAPLADRAAELANPETSIDFRIQAFTLAVSTRRLVALFTAAEAHLPGTGPHAAGEAADRLADGSPGLAHHHLVNFRAQALLLAGRIDNALTLLSTGDPHDATLTVLPYVLAASSGAASHPDWAHTVLHVLLTCSASNGHTVFYDEELNARDADAAYSDLLEQLLRERASTPAERTRWQHAGRAAVARWVRSAVGGKQRARYRDAARLAVALTEAEILTDGDSAYLDSILDTYRRFTAFRREAETTRRGSVLL